MAKKLIRFQPGMNLRAFLDRYGSEERCRAALLSTRWCEGWLPRLWSYRPLSPLRR